MTRAAAGSPIFAARMVPYLTQLVGTEELDPVVLRLALSVVVNTAIITSTANRDAENVKEAQASPEDKMYSNALFFIEEGIAQVIGISSSSLNPNPSLSQSKINFPPQCCSSFQPSFDCNRHLLACSAIIRTKIER